MSRNTTLASLLILSAVLLSVPFLVPGTGFLSLVAFVPLLFAEEIATSTGMKKFCWWHFGCFLLWNLATTFWVCNATFAGGIFAAVANAFQMSLVFGLFRWSRKHLSGPVPYIFLMFAWIAWERYYLTWAQISWPWLVLGNSFARTTDWIQWYEYTGTLGGSLWIWATNLSIFGIIMAVCRGGWKEMNWKAKSASILGVLILLIAPPAVSMFLKPQPSEGSLDVYIAQPNLDPYSKFESLTQEDQTAILVEQLKDVPKDTAVLVLAPETFTNDVITNDISQSPTVQTFKSFLQDHPKANILFGASTHDFIQSVLRPSKTARQRKDGIWYESHNSALMEDAFSYPRIFHKSKLVVGVESTPYPAVFRPIDDLLGGVMGRDVGQSEVSNLAFCQYDTSGTLTSKTPVGCAVCYESVYGEYCTEYVRKGAKALTIITNDAWWKDTPGYRQHLSYACLRAIETRRWIARCANTGISSIIDPAGRITDRTQWWERETLQGKIGLSDEKTFFVEHGDYVGRICVLMFLLIFAGTVVRKFTR